MPGVFVAPIRYAFRFGWDDETPRWCLDEFDFLLARDRPGDRQQLIEPVLSRRLRGAMASF
jgi:hypothetical protein